MRQPTLIYLNRVQLAMRVCGPASRSPVANRRLAPVAVRLAGRLGWRRWVGSLYLWCFLCSSASVNQARRGAVSTQAA